MSRQMAKRLDRLEAHADQARRYQLVVRYQGDPEPAEDDTWTLVVWVHRPWCTTTAHPGGCEPRAVEEESSYASLERPPAPP